MGKKFTESKGFNIILSILIAIGLWVYVTSMVSDEITRPVSVPVTVAGEDVLASKGLMLDPDVRLALSLRLTASRTTMVNVVSSPAEAVSITVNVASIEEAGTYTLPCTINSKLVTVEGKNEQTIQVTVSKMLEKTVEVRASFKGTLPEGYRTNSAEITPSAIRIQGPEDVVNKIQYAQVTINGDQLSKTYSGDLGFSYIAEDGSTVTSTDVTANVDTVNVILPVVKTLDIPLAVEVVYGGGITSENFDQHVTIDVEPKSIQVSGDEADVGRREGTTIVLGKVDLGSLSGTYRFPIQLASELTNDSGISEATVTVKVSGLETKTLECSNIEIINAASGFTATAVTQSLQVKVRGPAEALAGIESYQLQVVVDLKDEPLRPGQFSFPAKVYLDGDSQCGVVTGDVGYNIVVNIQ